jgi:hypothetical protein
MPALITLYLFAVRAGDRPLARALATTLRSNQPLRDEVDRALLEMPRGAARWSPEASRVVSRLASILR